MTTWFGTSDPFALILYLWTDIALNKLLAIVSVVLAGGVVVQERDLRVLSVLWAKPISKSSYFLLKAGSACGVMAVLYLGAHLVGLPWFGYAVAGFRPAPYLASMTLHLWSALFATALAATMAVAIGRRMLASLVTLLLVFTMVGASFLGFYNPAWADAALINPFSLGVQALAHLGDLTPVRVLVPMAALVGMTGGTVALGAALANRLEA